MPTVIKTSHLSPVDNTLLSKINKLSEANDQFWSYPNHDRRENVHSFFQYPAMMVPAVTKKIVDLIIDSQPGITNIFDPFVGAGTTLIAAMHHGLNCFGQDVNPLAILISQSKTGPFYCTSLVERTETLLSFAQDDSSDDIEADFLYLDKWFQHDVAMELSKLVRAIRSERFLWARRFYWVTLAETVRLSSNDRTSTYKLHSRISDEIAIRDISPLSMFSNLAKRNVEDLNNFRKELECVGSVRRGRYLGEINLSLRDTKEGIAKSDHQTFDLLVTSPPYGDNTSTITYGQHSYLPLQWINLTDITLEANESYLRTTQEIDRRSLGGKRERNLENQIAALEEESASLLSVLKILEDKPRDRRSRISSFYTDFIQTLDKIIGSMTANAYLVWTIGNRHVGGIEIPNDQILIELLNKRNVILVKELERNISQKRMPERNQISETMKQEKILIFRKKHIKELNNGREISL